MHNDMHPRNVSTKESFILGNVLLEEKRSIPASLYKKTLKLKKNKEKAVFVPVRSMQYLAIIDTAEIVFVNGLNKRLIEFSWNNFNYKKSMKITDPVEYILKFYVPGKEEEARRMQREFEVHVDIMLSRLTTPGSVEIIEFTNG